MLPTVDRWAYFLREAENLKVVPPTLRESPYKDALEVARPTSIAPS